MDLLKATGKTAKSYRFALPTAPKLFANNPFLAAELKRVKQEGPAKSQDWTAISAPDASSDAKAWAKALEKAKALVEYEKTRATNLQLLSTYGKQVWTQALKDQDAATANLQRRLADIETRSQQVNRKRKAQQLAIQPQLQRLEAEYHQLLAANQHLEAHNANAAQQQQQQQQQQ
jgi:hypothetical protein